MIDEKYQEMRDLLRNKILRKEGMTVAEILAALQPEAATLFEQEEVNSALIKKVLRDESKDAQSDIMQGKKKRGALTYKLRPARNPFPAGRAGRVRPITDVQDSNRVGRAGEFAVLSELTFRGYNANIMSVDEGIDIVASKDNIFYFIQVKTTYLDEKSRFNVSIPREKYDKVKSNNVIYIFVVRQKIGEMKFFMFHQNEIQNGIISRVIEQTDSNINIKVEYDSVNHEPRLYNGNNWQSARPYQAEIKSFDL